MKIKNFLFNKEMELGDKAYFIISSLIRLTLVIAIIAAIFFQDWSALFPSILALALSFSPELFQKTYKIQIPVDFQIMIVVFIYASIFLGGALNYYDKFWWWDIFLHTWSGLAIGLMGFVILFVLYKGHKINAHPFIISLFTFLFVLGIGALWEIYEFSLDQIFGTTTQKSGLMDTMTDLIVDALGALVASISGYFYLIKGESFLYKRIIDKFSKKNPVLFDKAV